MAFLQNLFRGKGYRRLQPSERPNSQSSPPLVPGKKGEHDVDFQRSSPTHRHRRFAIGVCLLILSLGFNAVWFLGIVAGKADTCYPSQTTRLVEQERYATVLKSDNQRWVDVLGGTWGSIYTRENREDGVVRMGGISMFHQLHCLDSFRHAIQELQDGRDIGYDLWSDKATHKGHWPHCFDYLRQTVLCHADDTVETSKLAYTGEWIIEGYGTPRKCRNAKPLYEATACGEKGCPGTRWALSDEEFVEAKKREWNEGQAARLKGGLRPWKEPDWDEVLKNGSRPVVPDP